MKRSSSMGSQGGVLVIVLVLMMVAAGLTAGWIAIMSSQIAYVDQASAGVKRRIGAQNATALARQYILSRVLTRQSAPAATADIGNDWGSVVIGASTAAPLSSFSKEVYNHFNPASGGAYTYDLSVAMTAGGESFTRLLQAKSRSTVLSGTPLWLGAQASAVTGSIVVGGETLIWAPSGAYSVASASFALPSEPAESLNGTPSNFPFVPLTGSEIANVPSYAGALNVVDNGTEVNSLASMANRSAPNGVQEVEATEASEADGVTCDGFGNVEIDLQEAGLGNVRIVGAVTHLKLIGQTTEADRIAAANAAAVLIVISDADTLTQVDLEQTNERKVALGIKKSGSASGILINFPQAGLGYWRIVLTLEGTPVNFGTMGATQNIRGGIQTDRPFAVAGGSVNLIPESDPKLLDRLTARDGWVEAYDQ